MQPCHLKFVIACMLFAAQLFSSCQYSLPLIKQQQKTYTMNDTIEGQAVMAYVTRYNYFRISRYGFTGNCHKYLYYDASGRVVGMRVSRLSAPVCDGFAVHHWRLDLYTPDKKLRRKVKGVTKEKGWSSALMREKTIDYSSGKRVVTRIRS